MSLFTADMMGEGGGYPEVVTNGDNWSKNCHFCGDFLFEQPQNIILILFQCILILFQWEFMYTFWLRLALRKEVLTITFIFFIVSIIIIIIALTYCYYYRWSLLLLDIGEIRVISYLKSELRAYIVISRILIFFFLPMPSPVFCELSSIVFRLKTSFLLNLNLYWGAKTLSLLHLSINYIKTYYLVLDCIKLNFHEIFLNV